MTVRRFLASAMLVGVIAAVALGASRSAETSVEDEQGPTPLAVPTTVARQVDSFVVGRTYTGLVASNRSSELGFERSARVVRLLVDEGSAVESGALLAELDTRKLLAQRDRLVAQRDEARAILQELVAGPRVEVIAAARAEVRDWNAQLELQRRTLARTTELVNQNAVSRERHDEAELGVESIKARLDAAQKRLDELEAGTRREKIEAQEAVVQQLTASIANVDIDLQDSRILAPFAGRISRRMIDEGTVVSATQPVLEIVETDQLEARIGLPPRVFDRLEPCESVVIEIGGRRWNSTWNRSAATVDLRTRTRAAIFELESAASETVVPGEVARATFNEVSEERGFWLPTTSMIRSTRGLWAIYVAQSDASNESELGSVSRREVEVIHTDGERSFVRGLIRDGDRVIVAGTQRVVPGQKVRAVAASPSDRAMVKTPASSRRSVPNAQQHVQPQPAAGQSAHPIASSH